MEPTHERDGFRDESQRNQFTTDQKSNNAQHDDHKRFASDERERSNDGDWNSMREEAASGDSQDYTNENDNSGGAGSTGSEATNSGNSDI